MSAAQKESGTKQKKLAEALAAIKDLNKTADVL